MHRIQGLPSLLLLSSACWVLLSKFYIRGTNWDKEEQKSFHHCVNMNPASMSNVFRGSLPSQCTQGHLSIVNHIWHKHCLTSWLTSDHLHFFSFGLCFRPLSRGSLLFQMGGCTPQTLADLWTVIMDQSASCGGTGLYPNKTLSISFSRWIVEKAFLK